MRPGPSVREGVTYKASGEANDVSRTRGHSAVVETLTWTVSLTRRC